MWLSIGIITIIIGEWREDQQRSSALQLSNFCINFSSCKFYRNVEAKVRHIFLHSREY